MYLWLDSYSSIPLFTEFEPLVNTNPSFYQIVLIIVYFWIAPILLYSIIQTLLNRITCHISLLHTSTHKMKLDQLRSETYLNTFTVSNDSTYFQSPLSPFLDENVKFFPPLAYSLSLPVKQKRHFIFQEKGLNISYMWAT